MAQGAKLESQAAAEARGNAEKRKKMCGDGVTYGTVVQLLHVRSNRFLTITRDHRGGDEDQQVEVRLSADEHGEPLSWLSLEPAYKADKMGQTARYSTALRLTSPLNGMSLALGPPGEAGTLGLLPGESHTHSCLIYVNT